jgi:cytochrome P450
MTAIPATDAALTLDPSDPAFIEDPYPTLNALREAAPLFFDERHGRWFVTRYDGVYACLRDKRLGRNFTHVATHAEMGLPPPDPRWQAFWDIDRWNILFLEPPGHTRIRKLLAAAFTPRSVEALREPAGKLAAELLEPLVEAGEMELITDYAEPFSVSIICRMLGVPIDRSGDLLDWSHRLVKMYEFDATTEQAVAATEAAAEFRSYVVDLIRERRARPREDMITGLVEARADGGRLSDDEIVCTVIVLLNAGHEATVNTLANGVRAFTLCPDQWRRLEEGDVPARAAIEEMIRWDPPLQQFERWVLARDFALDGVPVPYGAKLSLLFGAANRDPRQFHEPDRFDVGRPNAAQHIGFGGGIHVCIGAPLARIELEAALEALVRRSPHLDLIAVPKRAPTFQFRALQALRLAL